MDRTGVIGAIRRRSRRLRGSLLLGVALTAVAVGAGLQATGALSRLELLTVDARFDVRGAQPPPPDVVVVGIDDKTFDMLTPAFPLPRSLYADVMDRLREAEARVIAFDLQFTEPSPEGQEDEDEKLFDAIERARGKVLLATTEVRADGATRVLGNDEFRRSLGARVGNAVMPADANGVIRRIRARIDGLDSFAFVAAEMAGRRPPRSAFGEDGAWIDFHGPHGTLRTVSFGDVHAGRVAASTFRDKVVVVGAEAPSLQDVAATSASKDELMSGPEIQAEATSTILRGLPLKGMTGWLGLLFVTLMAIAAPVAARRLRALRGLLGAVLLGLAYLGAAQLAFGAGLIIPVVAPLVALAIGAVGALASLLVVEALERQRVRDVFAHFVPPSVVDDVLANAGDELRLGGTRRECTVLFSDLRGFTSFSETRSPEEVIEILNEYLSEMSDAILDHGGTLLAFLGDGVLALFGAPLDQPDHRDRAVAAARAMLDRLDAFNARVQERGWGTGFQMGIGINTGDVMCGNVGSERRLEYTAIGDTVNTASRIEGMTKETGHPVHLTKATLEGLSSPQGYVAIAELPVRGRQGTVYLYGLEELAPRPGLDAITRL